MNKTLESLTRSRQTNKQSLLILHDDHVCQCVLVICVSKLSSSRLSSLTFIYSLSVSASSADYCFDIKNCRKADSFKRALKRFNVSQHKLIPSSLLSCLHFESPSVELKVFH